MFYILEDDKVMCSAEGKPLTYLSVDEAEYTLTYFDDAEDYHYRVVSIVDYALNKGAQQK